MKMELIEGSETSAIRTQTPGNYPKENMLQTNNKFSTNLNGEKVVIMEEYRLPKQHHPKGSRDFRRPKQRWKEQERLQGQVLTGLIIYLNHFTMQ